MYVLYFSLQALQVLVSNHGFMVERHREGNVLYVKAKKTNKPYCICRENMNEINRIATRQATDKE